MSRAIIGVFRSANQTSKAQWLLRNDVSAGDPQVTISFGDDPADIPVFGHGFGGVDPSFANIHSIGVFRPALNPTTGGRWLLGPDSNGRANSDFFYGTQFDVPVVGDWVRSGRTAIGVFRPPNTPLNPTSRGRWLLRSSLTPGEPEMDFLYGAVGDIPVVGDWDGTGRTSIGVFRPANTALNQTDKNQWLLRRAPIDNITGTEPDMSFSYGCAGDIPVVGDWTGIGITTVGVFRPANTPSNKNNVGLWLLRDSNVPDPNPSRVTDPPALGVPQIRFFYGAPGDVPVVGQQDPWF
jgi:hypothetical protein